jgi:tetratricopeptide (TPR) repeat protein
MSSSPLNREQIEEALLALIVAAPALAWRGPVAVYLRWLDEVLEAAKRRKARPALVTKATHVKATILTRFGRFKPAAENLERVIVLARESMDLAIEADAFRQLGMSYSARGEHQRGWEALERARALINEDSAPLLACDVEKAAGLVLYSMRLFDMAIEAWDQALDVARANAFGSEVAVMLHNIGDARARLDDFAGALEALTESIDECRWLGLDRLLELNELLVGCVEVAQTKRPEPLQRVEVALDTARTTGNIWVVIQAGYYLGRALIELGQLDRARDIITESLTLSRENDHLTYVEDCEALLAQL